MINDWTDLNYWNTGEYQVVLERLDDLDKSGTLYCPSRLNLTRALEEVMPEDVRVLMLGQDPYPDPRYATGIAFSIPETEKAYPPTLNMIFKEYMDDLHLPRPKTGSLLKWCEQGVLLWNVFPTCQAYKSLSHVWPEWALLTQEIIDVVTSNCIVVCAMGSVARDFTKFANPTTRSPILYTSHPSPRGNNFSKTPFLGSRIFSTINDKLNKIGLEPIEWRLS